MIPSYLTHCILAALARRRPMAALEFYSRCLEVFR